MQQVRDTPWSTLGWRNPQKMVSFRLASTTLQSLFAGKSINTAGFLLAVLLDLKLVHVCDEKTRSYAKGSTDAFMAEMKALIDSPVDLPQEPPATPTKKGTLKLKASSKAVNSGELVRG